APGLIIDDPFFPGGGGSSTVAIKKWAFAYSGIESFTFPETSADNGTYEIESYLFQGCENLETVNISSAVTSIDSVFAGCYSIESVTIAAANQNFTTQMDVGDSSPIIYNKTSTGVTAIRYYYGTMPENYVIPAGISEIGERAFEHHDEVKTITIPEGVTVIGKYAFSGCANLESVIFAGTSALNTLGSNAFENCVSLENVTLPGTITAIPEYTFHGCTSLKSISLADTVTSFGGYAFAESGLVSIEIPAQVTKIGEYNSAAKGYVFRNCTSLSRVTFRGNTQGIGYGAFEGCTALTNLYLPDSINCLASYAFRNTGVTSVSLPTNISIGNSGTAAISSAGSASGVSSYAFSGCVNLKEVTFRGDIPYITGNTFDGCTSLDTLKFTQSNGSVLTNVLPESLAVLGNYALRGTAIESIEMNNVLTTLGSYVFANCSNLKNAVLPYSLEKTSQYMFQNCVNLENVGYCDSNGLFVPNALPEVLATIEAGTFENCASIEYLSIPMGIQAIGASAFSGCINYRADNGVFEVPANISKLSNDMLKNCKAIEKIVLHPGVVSLSETVYVNQTTRERYHSAGATALVGMDSLKELVIPEGLPYTVDYNGIVYDGANLLMALPAVTKGEVEIPSNVTSIAPYAFNGNENITKVHFNDKIERIGYYAFQNCVNLGGEINLPETVFTIDESAFENTAITKFYLNNCTNDNYSNISNMSIRSSAFAGCKNLEEVVVYAGTRAKRLYLYSSTFANSGIKSIYFPATNFISAEFNITTAWSNQYGYWAKIIPASFCAGCTDLETVTIDEGILRIQSSTFAGCTGIEKIIIPASMVVIDANAFSGWTENQTIYFRASEADAPAGDWVNDTTCKANIVYGYTGD
ncbi:MAG: leucine-rich repeat protein, partial [Clostridia bacterium]|nr:leucine-rich repeat protein [Clostridia bacterium]